jgi:hypothetical protein
MNCETHFRYYAFSKLPTLEYRIDPLKENYTHFCEHNTHLCEYNGRPKT